MRFSRTIQATSGSWVSSASKAARPGSGRPRRRRSSSSPGPAAGSARRDGAARARGPPGQPSPGGTSTATAAVSGEVRPGARESRPRRPVARAGPGRRPSAGRRAGRSRVASPYRCSAIATASRTRQRPSEACSSGAGEDGRLGGARPQGDDPAEGPVLVTAGDQLVDEVGQREVGRRARTRCCRVAQAARCSSR